MVRLELIANRSVEADLYDLLAKRELSPFFTKFAEVEGKGNSGERHGDHIFPEENFVMLFYCEEDEAAVISDAVIELKRIFPAEGIKLYRSVAERVC